MALRLLTPTGEPTAPRDGAEGAGEQDLRQLEVIARRLVTAARSVDPRALAAAPRSVAGLRADLSAQQQRVEGARLRLMNCDHSDLLARQLDDDERALRELAERLAAALRASP